ncbi:MAG: hypothetical protein R3F60_21420 [bacterium]
MGRLPPASRDWEGPRRCGSTQGDGLFHAVPAGPLGGPFQAFGLRLSSRNP